MTYNGPDARNPHYRDVHDARLLAVALVSNALMRPVAAKHHLAKEE